MRECSLVFLYKPEENEILLAMKKRRLGVGKWNGTGGKLEGNEDVRESAVRETEEEITVKVKDEDLKHVATLDFFFRGNPSLDQRAEVFFVEKWEGIPAETEEMAPKWFKTDDIPFDSMWLDDVYWLPLVLKGENVHGTFTFNKDGSELLERKVSVV
jgi:8-oxo-dGTP pyrophosphatase MutT (NUDIX family)